MPKLIEIDLVITASDVLEPFVAAEPYVAATLLREQAIQLRNLKDVLNEFYKKRDHSYDWWATYRAALTGLTSRGDVMMYDTPVQAHEVATLCANAAHGRLPETPKPPE